RVKSKDAARNLATSQDYTFTTAAPPVITLSPATLPDPTAGVAYNQTITASGGFSPYTFGVLTGSLPPGLTLNASTGTIPGTPITSPMYFIVTDLYKLFGDQNADQPDLLLSADNHAGKMGDRQTLTTGPLQTNQTAPVSFLVGIGSRQPFEFYVDLYTSADGSP